MSGKVFTVEQAARHYGVSVRTIHRVIKRLDLGQKLPAGGFGIVVLTEAEFSEIGQHIRHSRGNPLMQTEEGRQQLLEIRRAKRAEAQKPESAPTEHPSESQAN